MMTVTEKAAYLKGLAEGLELDEKKPETKLIKAMIDVIDEMALSISDFEDSLDMVGEQLDAVDEDLADLEDYIFEEDEDDYEGCDCSSCAGTGDYFEVECPACGEVIEIPGSVAEEGEMDCPACGEHLEFDFDEDEDEEEKDEE